MKRIRSAALRAPFLGALLALLSLAPLFGAHAATDLHKVYTSYDTKTVTQILRQANLETQIVQLQDGSRFILVSATQQNGSFFMRPFDCNTSQTKCTRLAIFALLPKQILPYQSLAQNLAALNVLNENLPGVKMFIEQEQRELIVSRTLIGDQGYTKGSLLANTAFFEQAASFVAAVLFDAGKRQGSAFSQSEMELKGEGSGQALLGTGQMARPTDDSNDNLADAALANLAATLSEIPKLHDDPSKMDGGVGVVLQDPAFKVMLTTPALRKDLLFLPKSED